MRQCRVAEQYSLPSLLMMCDKNSNRRKGQRYRSLNWETVRIAMEIPSARNRGNAINNANKKTSSAVKFMLQFPMKYHRQA